MAAHINFKVKLGPLVSLEISGENCNEIYNALQGHENLTRRIDAMCNDLAEHIYPEGEEMESESEEGEEVQK